MRYENYTDQQKLKMKIFADYQSTCQVYDVAVELDGQEINNPFLDPSGRFYCTREILDVYEESFLDKWFEKAEKYLNEHSCDPF